MFKFGERLTGRLCNSTSGIEAYTVTQYTLSDISN